MGRESFLHEREHGVVDMLLLLATVCLAVVTWSYVSEATSAPLWKFYLGLAVIVASRARGVDATPTMGGLDPASDGRMDDRRAAPAGVHRSRSGALGLRDDRHDRRDAVGSRPRFASRVRRPNGGLIDRLTPIGRTGVRPPITRDPSFGLRHCWSSLTKLGFSVLPRLHLRAKRQLFRWQEAAGNVQAPLQQLIALELAGLAGHEPQYRDLQAARKKTQWLETAGSVAVVFLKIGIRDERPARLMAAT